MCVSECSTHERSGVTARTTKLADPGGPSGTTSPTALITGKAPPRSVATRPHRPLPSGTVSRNTTLSMNTSTNESVYQPARPAPR